MVFGIPAPKDSRKILQPCYPPSSELNTCSLPLCCSPKLPTLTGVMDGSASPQETPSAKEFDDLHDARPHTGCLAASIHDDSRALLELHQDDRPPRCRTQAPNHDGARNLPPIGEPSSPLQHKEMITLRSDDQPPVLQRQQRVRSLHTGTRPKPAASALDPHLLRRALSPYA